MKLPLRPALAVFLVLGAVLALFAIQWHGPAPRPADAPPGTFSATRAMAVLRATIDGTPHPIGTAANRIVRDRIAGRLQALGYETSVVRQFACDAYGACGWTENIIARPPGQPGGPTVLVVAHYDSVPAGPAASDDGTGVAALLEIARAVRAEHFLNPIEFLVDDGEEAGLLGAEAFLRTPTARFVSAVVNLEARGTSGPSFLFETSPNNRWFVPIIARALPHPATSSLFYTIYQLLPNDTDLTVFKRAGFTGVNFAFLGDVVFYHTPLDDIAHVNLRTLQDHGDNALAAVRALANTDLSQRSSDDAVWFDVVGLFVIWWPAAWTLFLAVLSLGMTIVAAAVLVRDGESTVNEIAAGFLVVVLSIVIAAVAGLALAAISSARSAGPWLALSGPAIAASWVAGIIATLAITGAMRRRARAGALFAGIAIAWSVAAVAVAILITGVSHLLLVPAIALAIASLLRAVATDDDVVAEIACSVVAAILWFPLLATIYSALGRLGLTIVAIGMALVATTFAPLFATRLRTAVSGVVAAIILAVVSLTLPPVTAARPQRISITYLDDGTTPRYVATTVTSKMRQLAGFARSGERLFPWSRGTNPLIAPAPPLHVPPVSMTKRAESAGAKRTVTIHVSSARQADRLALFFHTPATVERLLINGVEPPFSERAAGRLAHGWHVAALRGGGAMDVEITVRGHLPIEAIATDTTFGLPSVASALAAARTASSAVPSDDGDAIVTMRRAKF